MFSAVLLILQALKIEFDVAYVNEIFTAVLGLLVVVGIVIDPTKTASKTSQQNEKEKDSKSEIKEEAKLPITEKNEVNNINNENDIQIVLNKIASDLEAKLKEFSIINQNTKNVIATEQGLNLEQEKINEEKTEEAEIPQEEKVDICVEKDKPAVAEIENPYIDLNV